MLADLVEIGQLIYELYVFPSNEIFFTVNLVHCSGISQITVNLARGISCEHLNRNSSS